MLRVKRSAPTPLFFEEIEQPRDRLLDWAHRSPEERRQRRAPIDYDMFRVGHVVNLVASDFEGRCGFCERDIGTSEGIGHFRPLVARAEERSPDFSDHYSWLAYEWLNLFLICRRCQRAKEDHFPVSGHRARFLATFEELRAAEKPLLIDPITDNPSSHLSYLMTGECFARKSSIKGNTTVAILKLNDEQLIYERREAIDQALHVWRNALKERATLPDWFLRRGSFLGACRDVIVRTLAEYGMENLSINNGTSLTRRLQTFITGGDDDAMDRLLAVIELVKNSDRIRRSELERRQQAQTENAIAVVAGREPVVSLLAPTADLAAISITNFKAINSIDIPFAKVRQRKSGAPCMLLLGENAVGKSTCLVAFALALLGTREARNLRLPYHQLARSTERGGWDIWTKKPVEVQVRFHDTRSVANFSYDPLRGHIDGTYDQSAVVLGYGPHRYFATNRGRRGSRASQRVRSLFDSRYPLPDPSDWLVSLRGREFDQVARTIRTILPIGDDDDLVNDRRAGICVSAQGQLTPVSQLSEGYRSMFAMVADMCRSFLDHWSNLETAHGVVLIDEVETHLHPRWKMRVISSLRDAFPSVQFIATTHDPLCIRGMDDGEVVVLSRDESGGIQLVEDLPSVAGMRSEQLLTSEYFGLSSTVDPDIQLEIARLAEGVSSDPSRAIGKEADDLISRLTVGDSAAAQIIQEALLKYLRYRDTPNRSLSSTARADAVATVFKALRASRANR